MAITKRSTKGSALTFAEMDANLDELINLLTKITVSGGDVNLGGLLLCSAGVQLANNNPLYGADSGGVGRRMVLITPTNDVYCGDVDRIYNGVLAFSTDYLRYYSKAGAGTAQFTVTPTGDFYIGTTSALVSEKFSVQTATNAVAMVIRNSHNVSGDTGLYLEMGTNAANASSYFIQGSTTGVGPKFYILGNGNIQNANNSYGALSDQKLKTNITPARAYLDDLCSVQVRKYNFLNDLEAPQQLGVIAQELEQIFPGMIEETRDTAERQTVDGEGNAVYEQKELTPAVVDPETGEIVTPAVMGDDPEKPVMETYETGEVTKGVKYSVFVPMLITAVQELKTNHNALEARIAAIEASSN